MATKMTPEELAEAEKRMYSVGATTVGKRMDEEARNNSTKKESGEEMPKMKKGGSVKSSASRRADGCAQRGKTKGRML